MGTLVLLTLASLVGCKPDAAEADLPTLTLTESGSSLTTLAEQAVAASPTWLQDDLALTLQGLDETLQDELGALVVDLDDPYLTDEVAFSIAHLSPEVLADEDFYPQFLVINAELIYARDADLAYVELQDLGEPGVDADYETTATYQVEIDEERVERTLDRDTYYWYLVHPRLEDEYPYFIDGWETCSGSECASNPDEGMTWRQFLWDGATDECPDDRECPVIADYLDQDVEVLWKSKSYEKDDNGAIGQLIQWEMDAITFGAGDERPIQPNRIYAVGCGNCGEWADMA
ncbi:MAG: hypothetical protein QGG40_22570, partial [Myxococcota bacterium]|nr:hypothetical protein [Myxococcota bacterium]